MIVVSGRESGLELTGWLRIGEGGQGTVQLLGGGLVSGEGILVAERGELLGAGVLNGVVVNQGRVMPAGTLLIAGQYQQQLGGELSIELRSDGHDALVVDGHATLGGILQVVASPAFIPVAGDRYALVIAVSRSGRFGTVRLPEFGEGLFVELGTDADTVWLVVKSDARAHRND